MDAHKHRSSGDEFESILERQPFAAVGLSQQQSVRSLKSGTNGPCTSTYRTTATVHHWSIPSECCLLQLFHAALPNYTATACYVTIQLADHFYQPAIADSRSSANSTKATSSWNPITVVRSSASRPPDFIETVKQIRKELYVRGGISEDQNPPVLDTKDYSQWRKDVIQRWKPVSLLLIIILHCFQRSWFGVAINEYV